MQTSRFHRAHFLTAPLLFALVTAAAMAHPMGNFTVNHYSALTPAPGTMRLRYVLDMAELPTMTERQAMDTNEDSEIPESEVNAYLAKRVPGWMQKLSATVDGKPLQWTVRKQRLEFTSGVAGLAVMRVEVDADAPLAPGRHAFTFEDTNYGQRVGWKEIVLVTPKGAARPAGTEALRDISRALRAYPEEMLDAPLQVSKAAFTVEIPAPSVAAETATQSPPAVPATKAPRAASSQTQAPANPGPAATAGATGAIPAKGKPAPSEPDTAIPAEPVKPNVPVGSGAKEGAAPTAIKPPAQPERHVEDAVGPPTPAATPAGTPESRAPLSGSSSRWSRAFHELVTRKTLSPGALAVALLIAFLLGALHALQPGHGKTLVAAYLVGQRGTPRHAALLGLTVTISHTFGVFALGAVALYAQRYILPQDLFPWIGFASGVLIVLLGAGMLYGRLRPSRAHQHDHEHGHSHEHAHEHTHAAVGAHVHHHAHDHAHEHDHEHHHDHDHEHHHHEHSHHHHAPVTHSHGPFGEHTHDVPDQISIRSLLALGIGGGIVPCWDALIVLLGAISLHRVAFGMLLIVAFSAGLATTLTAAGLAVVWGRDRFGAARLAPARVRLLSMASHVAIILIGAVIAWRSLAGR